MASCVDITFDVDDVYAALFITSRAAIKSPPKIFKLFLTLAVCIINSNDSVNWDHRQSLTIDAKYSNNITSWLCYYSWILNLNNNYVRLRVIYFHSRLVRVIGAPSRHHHRSIGQWANRYRINKYLRFQFASQLHWINIFVFFISNHLYFSVLRLTLSLLWWYSTTLKW